MAISDNILNINKKSYENSPLFLGEKPGLFDTINKPHPELYRIYKDMKSRDWDENEHSFASCNTDFKTSPKSVYDMMIRTLAWQWEADTVAARSVLPIMAPFVTDTQLWCAFVQITASELVHSATYSEIVRGSFDNPDEVLQEILSIQASFKRLENVATIFEKAYDTSHKYALGEVGPTQETYNDIFMMMCALLVLERIQFMASFAITFAICDTGVFAPIGVNVQKICQDELDIHVRFDKYVIRSMMETQQGKTAFQQLKPQIQQLIDSVTEHEISWTMNDLFSEGRELIGVEANDVCDWVKICSKDVYDVFGLTSPFAIPTKHNLSYLKRWIDMGASQASPQEQRNSAYLLGGFVDDLGDEVIDF